MAQAIPLTVKDSGVKSASGASAETERSSPTLASYAALCAGNPCQVADPTAPLMVPSVRP